MENALKSSENKVREKEFLAKKSQQKKLLQQALVELKNEEKEIKEQQQQKYHVDQWSNINNQRSFLIMIKPHR